MVGLSLRTLKESQGLLIITQGCKGWDQLSLKRSFIK
jgi:hypothetical protein